MGKASGKFEPGVSDRSCELSLQVSEGQECAGRVLKVYKNFTG